MWISDNTKRRRKRKTKINKIKMADKTKVYIAASEPASRESDTIYICGGVSSTQAALAALSEASIAEIRTENIIPGEDVQAEMFRILKPKAKLVINGGMPDRKAGQALSVDLKIQGFINIMAANDPGTGERFIVAQKPDWDIGAMASVTIPVPDRTTTAVKKINNSWASAENGTDLIDENDLLDDTVVASSSQFDCGSSADTTGKRRACKNCSCGLAEMEAAEEANQVQQPTEPKPKSACGNCSKGDAFRCAGCPFLGKPAFEPGMERVILAMTDDI